MGVSLSDALCLGVIAGPHGIKGVVRVKSYTEIGEPITNYGRLHDKEGNRFDLNLLGQSKGMLLVSIAGVTTRNQAEELKGTELFIQRNMLPNTAEDEFYHADLIGLIVYKRDGQKVGVAVAMHNFGAGDILEIAMDGLENTILIPFSNKTVPDIDLINQMMVVEIPGGLLD